MSCSYSSDLTPSLGTFICQGCSPKKKKKGKKERERERKKERKRKEETGATERRDWEGRKMRMQKETSAKDKGK